MTVTGTCLCGACRITVPSLPTEVTECNCSLCRRLGPLWAYWPQDRVAVGGPIVQWARAEGATLDFHRCADCGCLTHWTARPGSYAEGRVGVNARLLDGFDLWSVPRKRIDGAADAWG